MGNTNCYTAFLQLLLKYTGINFVLKNSCAYLAYLQLFQKKGLLQYPIFTNKKNNPLKIKSLPAK